MSPYLRLRPEPSALTFACAAAALAVALGVALAGCGPARPSPPSAVAPPAPKALPSAPPPAGFPPSPERQPPPFTPPGPGSRPPVWLARDAPAGVREALGAVPGLFGPGDRAVLVAAAPVDLDGDGAPEWLVRVDGRRPDLNGRFWAFTERGRRWALVEAGRA